jgi:hypothetical protein
MHLIGNEVEETQDARVKQIPLVWVLKENAHDCLEDVVLDYAQDALAVFRSHDGLEELYDLDVDLPRVAVA